MGKNPEEEIQKKLIELELSVREEEARKPPAVTSKGTQLSSTAGGLGTSLEAAKQLEEAAFNADLCTFGGLALIGLSIFWLCTHIHVSSGYGLGMLLGGGRMFIGIFLLPIFVGIGMLFYNWRSRIAQFVTAGGIALLLFMVLMQLQMYFASVSLLELMLMVLPVCAGSAMLMKGHYKRTALKSITKSD